MINKIENVGRTAEYFRIVSCDIDYGLFYPDLWM